MEKRGSTKIIVEQGRASGPRNALIALGLLALVWEVLSRGAARPPLLFPPPTAILASLYHSAVSGELLKCLCPTLFRLGLGFSAGAAVGVAAGFICGTWRLADSVLDPLINAAYPIPKVALIPLLMFICGFGNVLIIVLAAFSAFFPMAVTVRAGVLRVDRTLVDAAVNLGAGRAQVAREVIFPSVVPYLLSGARLGLLGAIQAVVVAEMLLSARGMGRMLWLAGEWIKMEIYYGYLAVMALTGVVLVWGLGKLTRRLVPWAKNDAG